MIIKQDDIVLNQGQQRVQDYLDSLLKDSDDSFGLDAIVNHDLALDGGEQFDSSIGDSSTVSGVEVFDIPVALSGADLPEDPEPDSALDDLLAPEQSVSPVDINTETFGAEVPVAEEAVDIELEVAAGTDSIALDNDIELDQLAEAVNKLGDLIGEVSLVEADTVLDDLSAPMQDVAPVYTESFDAGVPLTEEAVEDIAPGLASEADDVVLDCCADLDELTEAISESDDVADEISLIETESDTVLDSLSTPEQDAAPVAAEAFDTGVSVTEEAVADIGPEVTTETDDVMLDGCAALDELTEVISEPVDVVDETSLIETGPDIVLDSLSALEQDAAPVDAEAFDTGVSVTEEAVADIGPEVAAETEDVVLGSLSAPEQDAALVDVETFDTGASVTEEAVADIGPEVAAEANDVVLDGLSTPAQDSVLVDAETFGTGASVTEEVVADLEPEVAAEDLCNTSVGCLDTDADAVDDITMEEAMALEEADQDETMEAEGSEPVALVESPDRNKEVSEPVHIEDNARPCSLPVGKAPDWAGEEVNCVVIQVHGINVAIPMEQIESTRKLADISLEIDLEREWILGQLRSGDHTITYILDGGCWLMPELHDPDKANYQDLIMLPGGYWGIACDEMVRSVRIPVDEVSWAVNRSKRPWLLGTYMKERCAILDVDTLVDQLNAAF